METTTTEKNTFVESEKHRIETIIDEHSTLNPNMTPSNIKYKKSLDMGLYYLNDRKEVLVQNVDTSLHLIEHLCDENFDLDRFISICTRCFNHTKQKLYKDEVDYTSSKFTFIPGDDSSKYLMVALYRWETEDEFIVRKNNENAIVVAKLEAIKDNITKLTPSQIQTLMEMVKEDSKEPTV